MRRSDARGPSAPTALASPSACQLQRKLQRSAPRPHNSYTKPHVHRRAHAAQRCSTDGAVRCGAVRCGADHRCGDRTQRLRRNRRPGDTVRSRPRGHVFGTCVDEDRMEGLCFPTRRSHRFQERERGDFDGKAPLLLCGRHLFGSTIRFGQPCGLMLAPSACIRAVPCMRAGKRRLPSCGTRLGGCRCLAYV